MKELNITKEWINNELKKNNVKDIKKVIYAEIQTDGKLYIQEKN